MSDKHSTNLPVPAGQSWEELLTEAIRPDFAVAVYMAHPDDAVLGRPLTPKTKARDASTSHESRNRRRRTAGS